MTTLAISKTSKFHSMLRERIDNSTDSKVREQARNIEAIGFDPDRIEKILGMPLRFLCFTPTGACYESIKYELQWIVASNPNTHIKLTFFPFSDTSCVFELSGSPYLDCVEYSSINQIRYAENHIVLELQNGFSFSVYRADLHKKGARSSFVIHGLEPEQ